ncbi:MAG: FprA family A-type flavoprotein [bacterium]
MSSLISPIPINDDIFWIGSNDRTTDLFESLWPLPRGITYNSYFLADQKVALIDTVKRDAIDQYVEKVKHLTQNFGQVDYLIINHMEPDHSGAITILRSIWPQIKIIGNAKTAGFLKEFYGITENIQVVQDMEELSLGKFRLKFFLTPMVHWPETMMTYEMSKKALFAGDVFGGFGAMETGIFDDEVDLAYYEDEILRYFSNVIGKYCSSVQRAIDKIRGLDIRLVASTHGPVWRSNPREIISRYSQWSRQEAEDGIVIVYGSMYGNTGKMMEAVARGIDPQKVENIRIRNVSHDHLSYLIQDAWKYKAVLFASPTYDAHLFPPMDQFIRMLERKGLKNRAMGIVGTYGWSGGALKPLHEFA